jgi:hypothetical protein
MARNDTRKKGTSLAKGPVGLLGAAMLAWGILNLVLGGNGFGSSPVDGTVQGESFLGFEGNGWTNLLWIAAGALLLFGAPLHWGAKTMALLVGLALGAASVIALVDGDDVFGIFAANGLTKLAWGASAAALLIFSLLPRVGRDKGRKHDADLDRDRDRARDRVGDHDRDRDLAAPAPQRERVVERETVATPVREPVAGETHVDRPGRFARARDEVTEHLPGQRTSGTDHDRQVVAPADGDGPRDHGRGPVR